MGWFWVMVIILLRYWRVRWRRSYRGWWVIIFYRWWGLLIFGGLKSGMGFGWMSKYIVDLDGFKLIFLVVGFFFEMEDFKVFVVFFLLNISLKLFKVFFVWEMGKYMGVGCIKGLYRFFSIL